MMRPPFGGCDFMIRTEGLLDARNTPVRFVSTTVRHCSTVSFSSGTGGGAGAGVVEQQVQPAEARAHHVEEREHVRTRQVGRCGERALVNVAEGVARRADRPRAAPSTRRPAKSHAPAQSSIRRWAVARPMPLPAPVGRCDAGVRAVVGVSWGSGWSLHVGAVGSGQGRPLPQRKAGKRTGRRPIDPGHRACIETRAQPRHDRTKQQPPDSAEPISTPATMTQGEATCSRAPSVPNTAMKEKIVAGFDSVSTKVPAKLGAARGPSPAWPPAWPVRCARCARPTPEGSAAGQRQRRARLAARRSARPRRRRRPRRTTASAAAAPSPVAEADRRAALQRALDHQQADRADRRRRSTGRSAATAKSAASGTAALRASPSIAST